MKEKITEVTINDINPHASFWLTYQTELAWGFGILTALFLVWFVYTTIKMGRASSQYVREKAKENESGKA